MAGEALAPFHGLQVAPLGSLLEQKLRQRHGAGHAVFEGLATLAAHQRVRVVPFRQEQKPRLAAIDHLRQRGFQRTAGRLTPGAVTVETEHHATDQTKQPQQMIFGGGGAQRGHGVVNAVLRQRHHVHVALDHHQLFQLAGRLTRLVQAVELAPLVKDRRLRRVEVFGLLIPHDPTAKGDGPTAQIAYREHHPVAEAIIGTPGVLAMNQQTVLDLHRLTDALGAQMLLQRLPPAGGITNPVGGHHIWREAAPLQVALGRLALLHLQSLAIEAGRHLEKIDPFLAFFLPLLGSRVVRPFPGHVQPQPSGQLLDCLGKGQLVIFHQKA